VPGDEDNRRVISVGDLLLQIEAIDVRQLHVKDEAGGQVGLVGTHVLAGRAIGDRANPM
jgi:hypothetical protein